MEGRGKKTYVQGEDKGSCEKTKTAERKLVPRCNLVQKIYESPEGETGRRQVVRETPRNSKENHEKSRKERSLLPFGGQSQTKKKEWTWIIPELCGPAKKRRNHGLKKAPGAQIERSVKKKKLAPGPTSCIKGRKRSPQTGGGRT